jgi:AraC family transcriptional regulator
MLGNTSSTSGNELHGFNAALESFKSGSVPAGLGALLETRGSSDQSVPPDGLREAVQEMFHAISSLLNEELESAQAYLQRAASALRLAPRSSEVAGIAPKKPHQILRGGLAPWQARVLKTHIETHLDATMRTRELAKLVQLSSYHFCRVFRVSFGDSPHSYVTRRRIERAQGLILASRLPLGQIAADCGFADQAHFTKLFRRITGESPGEWRRVRTDAALEGDHDRADDGSLQQSSLQESPSPVVADAKESPSLQDRRNIEIAGAYRAPRTAFYAGNQTPFQCTQR